MPKLSLSRDVLAKIAQNNQRAVIALEQVFEDVGDTFPSTIDEANALAGSALAIGQANAALLSLLADVLQRLETMPTQVPQVDVDDTMPRVHLGTISVQDADNIEVTGGVIDNTAIGLTTAADAKFKKVSASDQITSTVATGTAPLVIASTTKVTNLYVDRAASADTASSLGTAGSYPADATDLATCIALTNYIKSRNTSKGV